MEAVHLNDLREFHKDEVFYFEEGGLVDFEGSTQNFLDGLSAEDAGDLCL